LSYPLSPKTPALMIDIMNSNLDNECDDIERTIYLSIYDMTYRCALDAYWVDQLQLFAKCHSSSNTKVSNMENIDNKNQTNDDETSIVTNVST